jgi:hypothetical protein
MSRTLSVKVTKEQKTQAEAMFLKDSLNSFPVSAFTTRSSLFGENSLASALSIDDLSEQNRAIAMMVALSRARRVSPEQMVNPIVYIAPPGWTIEKADTLGKIERITDGHGISLTMGQFTYLMDQYKNSYVTVLRINDVSLYCPSILLQDDVIHLPNNRASVPKLAHHAPFIIGLMNKTEEWLRLQPALITGLISLIHQAFVMLTSTEAITLTAPLLPLIAEGTFEALATRAAQIQAELVPGSQSHNFAGTFAGFVSGVMSLEQRYEAICSQKEKGIGEVGLRHLADVVKIPLPPRASSLPDYCTQAGAYLVKKPISELLDGELVLVNTKDSQGSAVEKFAHNNSKELVFVVDTPTTGLYEDTKKRNKDGFPTQVVLKGQANALFSVLAGSYLKRLTAVTAINPVHAAAIAPPINVAPGGNLF